MISLTRALAGLLLILAVTAADRADAWGFSSAYKTPYHGEPWAGPTCDAPEVTNRVIERFNATEEEYWANRYVMASVVHARESALRQWEPTFIATRYCEATAYFADGERREVVYWLRSEQGFAGLGWGLQLCVVGLDEMMAYAPACRMLRPL